MNKGRRMWQFPWKYKESIVFVLGIISVGFILQYTLGNFDFHLFSFPINIISGAIMLILLLLSAPARKNSFYRWFSGILFSVTLIVALLLLGIVMGTLPQVVKINPENRDIPSILGFKQVTGSWAFVLIYILTLFSLGALIIRRLFNFNRKHYAFYLNHIGIWILLFSAGLGAADMKRFVMHVEEGQTEWRVYNNEKEVLDLPIAIKLNSFNMEEFKPKLTIIEKTEGKALPEDHPDFYQIDEKRPKGSLLDWDIKVEEYIHQAIKSNDSTYIETPMMGAAPAVKILATNRISGEIKKGWVCGGNMVQSYMTLPLNSMHSLVMTQAEPKRFVSDIEVFTEKGEEIQTLLEVNKPLRLGNWMIYQYSYDADAGNMSKYSSFELVYDPWLYPVYFGFALLIIGSVCLIWTGSKNVRINDME